MKALIASLVFTLSVSAFAANPKVIIKTSKGDIEVELFQDKVKDTVDNFLSYVKKGHYKGTIFHRVIEKFMIQGGGFDKDMKEKPTGKGIKNQATPELKNEVGTLAMARTSDPDSATAQFFINVEENSFLNKGDPRSDGHGYAVFGKVTSGMPVVNMIKTVKTERKGMYDDVPSEPVVILDIVEKK